MKAVVGAALVPGMPHLLAAEPAPSWKLLADAARQAGRDLLAAGPDAFVVLSTQWFTVLGHQFQVDPNPRGHHVDENWYAYDYGTLDYDLRVDVELAEAWACQAEDMGFQARRTRYDGFPVDTGTVVAGRLVDPDRSRPIALVSCNLYAAAGDLGRIAEAAARAAGELGRRVAFVAISGLSSGLIQRWIEPAEDRFEDAGHDAWNRRVLDLLAAGRTDEVAGPARAVRPRGAGGQPVPGAGLPGRQRRLRRPGPGARVRPGLGDRGGRGHLAGRHLTRTRGRSGMANEAAGFIEAEGFVPIFDAIDAMVKATEVRVNGVMRLGGGLVAVALGGDLATVEEAVEIGEETARAVSRGKVKSIIFASPSRPVAAIAGNPRLLDG